MSPLPSNLTFRPATKGLFTPGGGGRDDPATAFPVGLKAALGSLRATFALTTGREDAVDVEGREGAADLVGGRGGAFAAGLAGGFDIAEMMLGSSRSSVRCRDATRR